MNEPLTGKELEEAIQSRKDARELAREAAMKGDTICGAYFALRDLPLAAFLDDLYDYDDDDSDDIRPF